MCVSFATLKVFTVVTTAVHCSVPLVFLCLNCMSLCDTKGGIEPVQQQKNVHVKHYYTACQKPHYMI